MIIAFLLLVAVARGQKDVCATAACEPGTTCQPDPKQCFTTPCPQFKCVSSSEPTAAPPVRQQCYNCASGVTSYFDGCNSCTCNGGVATCTKRACAAVVADPAQCSSQCDGFVTTDGCTCVASTKTKCPTAATRPLLTKPPVTAAPQPCDAAPCAGDEICVNEPKVCVTTPCPQFACKKVQKCGCDNIGYTCERGLTCQANRCVPLTPPMLPAGVLDGTPLCVRAGGSCCGNGALCTAEEVCEQSKCIKKTECPSHTFPTATDATHSATEASTVVLPTKPVVVGGDCVTCATLPAGQMSFFDGCNTCSCNNGAPVCTKKACISLVPDPAQCSLRCDGAKTTDEPVCGTCECKGGVKTKCTKCPNGTCSTNEAGRPVCSTATQPSTRNDIDSEPGSAATATVAVTALLAAAALIVM